MNWCQQGVFFFMFILLSVASGEDEEKKPKIEIFIKINIFNVQDKRVIYCQGNNLKEKLEWYSPNNELVPEHAGKNKRIFVNRMKNDSLENSLISLFIVSAQIEDTGIWTCRSGELNETFNLVVGEKVVFNSTNESIDAEEGKSVTLHCDAKGYPEPKVTWVHYNGIKGNITEIKYQGEGENYQVRKIGNDTQLEIRNLSHQDSGLYRCIVIQQALAHYADRDTWLSVKHKPFIMDYTTQQIINERFRSEEVFAILDETKNITCSVLANPPPTYAWFRRKKSFDQPIPPEPDMVFTAEDGSYSVLMLRLYNTSYLGQYMCSATNYRGKVSILYHVSVGNKPNAPDLVIVVNASVNSITFNVSCSTCFIAPKDAPFAPDPKNLTLLGFSFAFAPVVEEFAVADWDSATELNVDIVDPDDTLFVVGPLPNNTNFYARVRSRNAAGFSSWINVSDTVATTDLAVRSMASIFLVIFLLLSCLLF